MLGRASVLCFVYGCMSCVLQPTECFYLYICMYVGMCANDWTREELDVNVKQKEVYVYGGMYF